jgi:flagella basal body P-ring formation protein FlgA
MLKHCAICLAIATPATADMVVAAHTIRAQTLLSATDLAIQPGQMAGTVTNPNVLIGQEARVAIYAGRPIRLSDVGPPAIVERNQVVSLLFAQGVLSIATEGRALDRAGVGELVRVMNMSSRTTISGLVLPDGRIKVSN